MKCLSCGSMLMDCHPATEGCPSEIYCKDCGELVWCGLTSNSRL